MKLNLIIAIFLPLGLLWAWSWASPTPQADLNKVAVSNSESTKGALTTSNSSNPAKSSVVPISQAISKGSDRAALARPLKPSFRAGGLARDAFNLNRAFLPEARSLDSPSSPIEPMGSDNSELEEFAEDLIAQSAKRSSRNSAAANRAGAPDQLPLAVVGERYCQLLSGLEVEGVGRYYLYRGKVAKGLSVYTTSGLLCGVPEEAGVFEFTVTAVSANRNLYSGRYELTVQESQPEDSSTELRIIYKTLAPASVGQRYTAQLEARGGELPYSWTALGLPDGFAFDSRAGVLSGVPQSPAVYSLVVQVQDLSGDVESLDLSLEVRETPLAITTQKILSTTVGVEYSFNFLAIGGAPPYSWQLVSGELPQGVVFNPSRGSLEGIAQNAEQALLRVRVVDSSDASDEIALSFVVADSLFSITSNSIPDGVLGQTWLFQFEAVGGEGSLDWSIINGELPQGVSLSPKGLWSGEPAAQSTGSLQVMVTDSLGASAIKSFDWSVVESELRILTQALEPPYLCFDYAAALSASGGTPPYSFELYDGVLPVGISLNPDGQFSGFPDGAAKATFSVRLRDSLDSTVERAFILDVQQAPLEIAKDTTVINGLTGQSFEFEFVADGGCPPLSWSFEYQAIPSGLDFSSLGAVSGSPGEAGDYSITVFVRDSLGNKAQQDFSLVVAEGELKLAKAPIAVATAGESYLGQITATGGSKPYLFSLIAGALPEGVALDANSGQLSGTPQTAGEYTFVIEVVDAGGSQESREYDLDVQAGLLEILTTELEFESARVSEQLNVAFRAQGGEGDYIWQSDSLVLSVWGLQLSSGGVLAGNVQKSGSMTFEVLVKDSKGQVASKSFNLLIGGERLHFQIASLLQEAVVGEFYETELGVAGGSAPYYWFLQSGELPLGLSIDQDSGQVLGVPEEVGSLKEFVVGVSDSAGQRIEQLFLLGVRRDGLSGVQGLIAVPSDSKVGLVWHNPATDEFSEVQLLRSEFVYPTSLADGELVYQGAGFHVVDQNVQNGQSYFYSAIAVYTDGSKVDPSDSAKARARPGPVALSDNSDPFIDAVADYQPLDPTNCWGCSQMPEVVMGFPKASALGGGSDDVVSLHAKVNDDGGASGRYGGSIVLRFEDNIVLNGPGVDFTVFENAFHLIGSNEVWIEPAVVDVSVDGVNFYRFPFDFVPHYDEQGQLNLANPYVYAQGFAGVRPVYSFLGGPDPRDPKVSGGDSFDLSAIREVELKWIQFIRITSTGDAWLRDSNGDLVRHSHKSPSWGASGTGNSGFDLDAVCAVNY